MKRRFDSVEVTSPVRRYISNDYGHSAKHLAPGYMQNFKDLGC